MGLTNGQQAAIIIVVVIICLYVFIERDKMRGFEGMGEVDRGVENGKFIDTLSNREASTDLDKQLESRQKEIAIEVDKNKCLSETAFMDGREFMGVASEYFYPINGGDTEKNQKYGFVSKLDDGQLGNAGMNYNVCHKSCCSSTYPPPFKTDNDPFIMANKDKFVQNNFMCNDGVHDTGCSCMTKKQRDYLANRGNNGRSCI